MSQSRTELISEIKKARTSVKSDLMYVKGLTKMKKKELEEIADMLKDAKQNSNDYNDDQDIEDELKRLEEEKMYLEEELGELQDDENEKKGELQELDMDDVYSGDDKDDVEELPTEQEEYDDNDEEEEEEEEEEEYEEEYEEEEYDDDDLINTEQFLKSLEKKVPEKKVPKKKRNIGRGKKYIENYIKKVMSNFSNKISMILKPFQKKYRNGTLTKYDVDDIVDGYNDMREDTKEKIELILCELDEDEDLNDRFYRYVNDYFDRQLQRVERLLN